MLISKFDGKNINKKIEKLEKEYDIKLPEIYHQFLLKYNGGHTPNTDFSIRRVKSDVRAFFGFTNETNYDLSHLTELLLFDDLIGDDKFPIAENCFGDYIVINLNEEQRGEICFYYHDRPKRYIHLTDDLIEFMGKCKSEKIGHIRTIEERKKKLRDNGLGKHITRIKIKGWQDEIDYYSKMHQEEVILP